MKYLRKYNESVDLKNDILDICHAKLAYLLDDSSYKVQIIETVNHYKVKLVRNEDGPERTPNKSFNFSEIRDYYIGFIEYLDLKIGIDDSFCRTPGLSIEFGTFHTATYVTIDELEYIEIKSFGVSVYVKKLQPGWLSNESKVVEKQSVRDFCLDHLAYLIDKDYHVISERINGVAEIKIEKDNFWKTRVGERSNLNLYFEWDKVKDYLIPFFTHLKRHYGVQYFGGNSPTLIEFYLINTNSVKILLDDIINDNFELSSAIGYIKFSVNV